MYTFKQVPGVLGPAADTLMRIYVHFLPSTNQARSLNSDISTAPSMRLLALALNLFKIEKGAEQVAATSAWSAHDAPGGLTFRSKHSRLYRTSAAQQSRLVRCTLP